MRISLISILLIILTVMSATAQNWKRDWNACIGKEPSKVIVSCTAILTDFRQNISNDKRLIALIFRGLTFDRMGDHDRAIRDFDEAIRLDPNDAATYRNRGFAYYLKGNYNRAVDDCGKAVELNPNDASAFDCRAAAYLAKGDYDRTIRDLNEVIRINPESAIAFNNRGAAYYKKGDYDRSIHDLDRAITLDPTDADAFVNRGFAYHLSGDYDRAIHDYDKAIRLDPKNAIAFNERGTAYYKKGDDDGAIRDYGEAIRLDPKFTDPLRHRADIRLVQGDPERALADYEAVLHLNYSDLRAIDGRWQALAELPDQKVARILDTTTITSIPMYRGRKLALVFGINNYRNIPALSTASNDAKLIATVLQGLGFETQWALDPDRRAMNDRITDFEARIRPGDFVFFYFAGYGIAYQGRNWLLPADMPEIAPGSENTLEDEAFAANSLLDRFRLQGVRINVLVLDASRNNPFEKADSTRSAFAGTRGLERMPAPEGVFIFYSAAEKEHALDRLPGESHPNSVFTRILAEELKRPGRRLLDIALATQGRVRDLAQKAGLIQRPAYYDNFVGGYALRLK